MEIKDIRGEVITVSEDGGEKGSKPERYDLLPWEALDEVARVYGMGAQKYAAHNWRRGYPWGLSLAAAGRHIAKWAQGETFDPESGLHHLAHACFHMLVLVAWEMSGRYNRYDDRYKGDDT